MGCRNCNFTGRVALTNNDGQVYEYRNCPLCTCRLCGGFGIERYFTEYGFSSWRLCEACRPDRFDAHVEAYKGALYAIDPVFGEAEPLKPEEFVRIADPSPKAFKRNVEEFLNPPPEYYERIYRRCLNPFQRFCRWLTHNPDGSKRNG